MNPPHIAAPAVKGTPEEGATQKTFKVQRAPDGKVWFFSLSVGGRAHPQPVNISVAITNSEFTVGNCDKLHVARYAFTLVLSCSNFI